ncbi:hypothetical protein ACFO1B_34445 [Dactylosporangium siamense]|uniref:Uncharacterized protein n=1 Tax=Dactylosporangium siamense TaxID=685454 RepID=A0A919PLT9_9ACTN|nr:hypothetical protein [Dactylosporangium siamense]GIG44780.1 hypothetical protein Dsi01nite_028210 [Dactylosporangium siamense]
MSPTLGGVTGPAQRATLPTIPRQRVRAGGAGTPEAPATRKVRFATVGAVLAGVAVLLLGYLRMARATPTNSDASANALQAWDMLHGDVLLRGWTLSDVSFYTTELIQYALIEVFYGLDQDVVHVASATTYLLLIVFASLVAKGDATGRAAWARVAVVVATLLVPQPHGGWAIVLYAPDHTGTAVPLLLAWLLVDRRSATPLRRWWPVGVLVILALAQVADPLAMFVGAVPLTLVSAARLVRARTWRGTDAHLLVAAVGSMALAHGLLALIWWAGGFSVHSPVARFSPADQLGDHVATAVTATAHNYGAYLPSLDGPVALAAGIVNLALLLLAVAAFGVTVARFFRPAEGDRVAEVMTAAIMVNLAAFIASTQAGDMGSARQIVTVLPFGAALAGRLWGERLLAAGPAARRVMAAGCVVLVVAFGTQAAAAEPEPPEAHAVAEYLVAHDLRYGLGSYWGSNNITVASGGKVHVAPVIGPDIRSFRWESDADWYDAAAHDARFLVVDLKHARYGTVEAALAQFGPPVERHDFGRWALLVYDHNLLVGLPAQCGGLAAATHSHCPALAPKVPGAGLLEK